MRIIFIALFVFMIGQRLFELSLSRRNQQLLRAKSSSRRDSSFSFAVMVAVHLTWGLSLAVESYYWPTSISLPIYLLALLLFILAQSLRVWTLLTLGAHWNVNVIDLPDQSGQPNFISSGPYHFIRHPNYLAVIMEFISLPILGGAPMTAIIWSLLNGIILSSRIKTEESFLFRRSGYQEIMGIKPALIPSLFKYFRVK